MPASAWFPGRRRSHVEARAPSTAPENDLHSRSSRVMIPGSAKRRAMNRFGRSTSLCALAVVAAAAVLAQGTTAARAADPVADFYSGKNVQLVIAYPPAPAYDVYPPALPPPMAPHT